LHYRVFSSCISQKIWHTAVVMTARPALPNLDMLRPEALKALILAQQKTLTVQAEEIRTQRERLHSQDEQLAGRQAEIERLQLLIAKLRRMQFGRRSEKLERQIEQLELQLDELATAQAEPPAASPTPAAAAPAAPGRKPARRPLPGHLPRQTRTILPKETACPDCGGELKTLGEDVSEILEYVPAQFQVIQQVRPKLACTHCDKIVQAEAPSRPIPRGLAGPGLLAHVLVSKYCDHLPLYRQEEIYARVGVELERTTLADWVGGASQLLAPLVEVLRRHVIGAAKLHADDTPVPVLAPGLGKTKTGRLWTYVRDDRPAGGATPPGAWFAYSPDRKGEHPQGHLRHFAGTLQADGYAGFDKVYETGAIREAACWAHVRRKFYDLQVAHHSPAAKEALEWIGALYDIESEIRGRPPDERRAIRQTRAQPLLESFRQWLEQCLTKLSQKSDTTAAVKYALGRWEALTRYAEDGSLEIDNNAAERALRAVALGRKNYLFAGSDTGGERAATLYSLIGTAKLNGLDPESYLRDVLSRLPDHPINRIEELLPWNLVPLDTAPPPTSSDHPASL
jgi:transposase